MDSWFLTMASVVPTSWCYNKQPQIPFLWHQIFLCPPGQIQGMEMLSFMMDIKLTAWSWSLSKRIGFQIVALPTDWTLPQYFACFVTDLPLSQISEFIESFSVVIVCYSMLHFCIICSHVCHSLQSIFWIPARCPSHYWNTQRTIDHMSCVGCWLINDTSTLNGLTSI